MLSYVHENRSHSEEPNDLWSTMFRVKRHSVIPARIIGIINRNAIVVPNVNFEANVSEHTQDTHTKKKRRYSHRDCLRC